MANVMHMLGSGHGSRTALPLHVYGALTTQTAWWVCAGCNRSLAQACRTATGGHTCYAVSDAAIRLPEATTAFFQPMCRTWKENWF